MKSKFVVITTALGLIIATGAVFAVSPNSSATFTTPGTQRTLILPPAAANSRVIELGTAIDPVTQKVVQGYAVFHHKDGHGGGPGGPGGGGGSAPQCYGFLAKDAKWKTVEPWEVNASNIDGMDADFVFSTLTNAIDKWEDAATENILGIGSLTGALLVADTVAPDGKNEVYFADISEIGAVGVTIVWGIFNGPPFARELIEWDQVYDDVDYDWGDASINPVVMDFESVGTHELGHSVGLADLYQAECNTETMYGIVTEGEIIKRDLGAGDIAGVSKLY